MGVSGALLRISNLLIRGLQLCTSVIIVGIFGYFIAVLVGHSAPIARWIKAVEGLSGAAALYTLLGVILTLFLGGILFFAILAIILDICFIAAFIAIAVMTRSGTESCSGNVQTPLGNGPAQVSSGRDNLSDYGFGGNQQGNYRPNLKLACRLQKGVFALAIIGM